MPKRPNEPGPYDVPLTWKLVTWGIVGVVFTAVPFLALCSFARQMFSAELLATIVLAWVILAGHLACMNWSNNLHERLGVIRSSLDKHGFLTKDEKERYPGRVPWIPAMLGLFERALYATLVGLNVPGGASFIAVWIGLKQAGGWQVWSKGDTYGRALFFIGLLGNAMSIALGVTGGLVIRQLLSPLE